MSTTSLRVSSSGLQELHLAVMQTLLKCCIDQKDLSIICTEPLSQVPETYDFNLWYTFASLYHRDTRRCCRQLQLNYSRGSKST